MGYTIGYSEPLHNIDYIIQVIHAMNVIRRSAPVGNALSPPVFMSIFTCDGGLKIVHYCLMYNRTCMK